MPESAEIAIIVPWNGDAPDFLIAQVRCLVRQDIDEPLDIRIAANSVSALRHSEAVSALSRPCRTVRMINASGDVGAAYARNSGVSDAPARYLLFCDADDEADSGWARSMIAALRKAGGVVGGRICYERLNDVSFALSRRDGLPVAFTFRSFTPSASLGIMRELFDSIGGFDDALASGEDIDLCWRAQYAGAPITYQSEAILHYRLRQSVRALWWQGYKYGYTDVQLYLRHRAHGMSRTAADSVMEVVRLTGVMVLAPLNRRRRLKAVLKLGTVVGHLLGSWRHRTYFI